MHNDKLVSPALTDYLLHFWQAVGGNPQHLANVTLSGEGEQPSVYAYTDFATAAIAAANLAVAELVSLNRGSLPQVQVDRRLASFWFSSSLRSIGWQLPALWDAVAGDYRAADGWIRLHTNAPHHRDAALAVLGTSVDRDAVAKAVSQWRADELEAAIVANNGCAAAMRSTEQWRVHPQGQQVWQEPLLHWQSTEAGTQPTWQIAPERPLRGIRVLDLTRVLAGPVATRFLAGFGADVLRIDPYGWEEPGVVPEVILGKRCARLDLKNSDDRQQFERLLAKADVLVHGYRPDALAALGLGVERRQQINPTLIDVCLDAYGWSGPWAERRGFDSLIQMSTGIAELGMRATGSDRPVPLPAQAIDHATGYLLAAAAVRGLTKRLITGKGSRVQGSLARTAKLLVSHPVALQDAQPLFTEHEGDLLAEIEHTSWGPARRLKPAGLIEGTPMYWDYPASALGTVTAQWR